MIGYLAGTGDATAQSRITCGVLALDSGVCCKSQFDRFSTVGETERMEELIARAETLVEALPYIKDYFGRRVVVKFGGSALSESSLMDSVAADIVLMKYVGINPIVIHGGGPEITKHMKRFGKPVKFVDGLRVTDAEGIEIVKMVLVGKVNTEIVSAINQHGSLAVGVSGEDGRLLEAEKRRSGDVDLGYVGDVRIVQPKILEDLMARSFIPVVASIGAGAGGESYNINADAAAAAIATALAADKIMFLTNVKGLYRDVSDPDSLISVLDLAACREIVASKQISEGMLPKAAGCVSAVEGGVKRAHILDGRIRHALLLEIFTDAGIGTMITRDMGGLTTRDEVEAERR